MSTGPELHAANERLKQAFTSLNSAINVLESKGNAKQQQEIADYTEILAIKDKELKATQQKLEDAKAEITSILHEIDQELAS